MAEFLNPPLCANIQDGVQCQEVAISVACSTCFLVQYCSLKCLKEHEEVHKKSVCNCDMMKSNWIPDWAKAKRTPQFADGSQDPALPFGPPKFFWGNMDAVDLLNLKKNEGTAAVDRDFGILCAASGDIRNVLKSIAGLPDGYTGQCSVVMNDIDFDIVARNAIFLLIAFHLKPEDATPAIIHLWYSAFLPPSILAMLQEKILPLIDDVCTKIANKSDNVPLGKIWTLELGQSLRVVFTKAEWNRLKAFLTVPSDMSVNEVNIIRLTQMRNPTRTDYRQKAAYNQWPAFRTCNEKFRRECILLPFGTSRKEFTSPNPTFLQTLPEWPFRDDAEPHCGWSHEDVLRGAQVAKEDMLGSLFFMVRDLLLAFCRRVQTFKIKFRLYALDARDLPTKLNRWNEELGMFDRIEVSNISDLAYVGPALCLWEFAPLLKPLSMNPHAAILFLFQGAVVEMDRHLTDDQRRADTFAANPQRYMTIPSYGNPLWDPDVYKFIQCADGLRDWDQSWARFEDELQLPAMVADMGLKMRTKEEHTLVKPWPKRMSKDASQEEFDFMVAKYCTGFERYVELVRKE
ncbi:hypothetical protein K505DRAFT_382762 [Melanomma pulvis-pyrius CBS 109.77]|uniref:DUF4470 domain-containing protein n=1 Tax=Melanomma pulvis-pyrius CBS 109.77 TaxID=1314802 RepID=A0A6A6XUN9_9PLEO|nr:hypothetical protein K505DRAFT_382762 [Melanomma pulvis-pyrius CBS 109.77]